MRLKALSQVVDFQCKDIYDVTFDLSTLRGKKVMLSFFRDANCPFCNFRIYELTNKYDEWKSRNFEIVAVFSSPSDEVRQYVARHPRPFRVLSDPELSLYNQYGVEHSSSALLKALLFNLPRIIRGILAGGRPRKNANIKLVPADFLIGTDGIIKQTWYGRNASDHIPMEQVQSFINSK